MSKSKIEWTDETWNPVTGCTKVSTGCKNCYAEREWPRMTKLVPAYVGREFTDVRTHADRLDKPLHWKRPRRVFVNSMSDLFHESVPDAFIDKVFAVMALAPQHRFQVLTKRPERMRDYVKAMKAGDRWISASAHLVQFGDGPATHVRQIDLDRSFHHVWLSVSIEDQATANERIPLLLDTPAEVHWVSAEPLLGPVDLECLFGLITDDEDVRIDALEGTFITSRFQEEGTALGAKIDWVVVGGESGPKARPMHPQWARSLRDRCAAAGVPFLFKQWGEWAESGSIPTSNAVAINSHGGCRPCEGTHGMSEALMNRVGKKTAGRLLDGVQHDGYPDARS